MRRHVWALLIALSSCVNEYVVERGEATTSTGPPQDETSAPDPSTSADSDPSSTGASSEDSATSMSTEEASASDGMTLEGCQDCSSDVQCSTMGLCVDLNDEQRVCLRPCGEGCPPGFSCGLEMSIEGATGMVCTPDSGMCAEG